jgi:transposase
MRRRHELTDKQWDKIKDLLPGKATDPGRTAADNRLFVDAVLYVLKTGVPWADLPERFGKHNTIWKRYDRWAASGVWQRVGQALGQNLADADADAEVEIEVEVQLDSTSVKADPVAATGRRRALEEKRPPTSVGRWAAAAEA